MSGTMLDAKDIIVSITGLGSAFRELTFGEAYNNQKLIESKQLSCKCHKDKEDRMRVCKMEN